MCSFLRPERYYRSWSGTTAQGVLPDIKYRATAARNRGFAVVASGTTALPGGTTARAVPPLVRAVLSLMQKTARPKQA